VIDCVRKRVSQIPLSEIPTPVRKGPVVKIYSQDLRERVVNACDKGNHTRGEVATLFGVSTAWIRRLLQRRRATGSIAPRPHAGGRKRVEERDPTLTGDLERLLADETAGDPMSDAKWVRSSTQKLRDQLRALGHQVSHSTVHRLLMKMGFSLKFNKKRRVGSQSPERDEQFRYIASQKAAFREAGMPIISVDTKKKELIGPFRNRGRAWCKKPPEVNDHDFTSLAECRAVPFGIYDVAKNEGHVTVGVSNDTSEFAVKAIASWWEQEGRHANPQADKVLILADCGGTNGCRSRSWKLHVQEKLCDKFGLSVTVCHFPPGCSKWNPVERRLFSQISLNWEGKPLRSLNVRLAYIRGTTTTTGLTVKATLDEDTYRKAQKIDQEEMDRLNITRHTICPAWNYTLSPRHGIFLDQTQFNP
jgi:transposase